MDQDSKREGGQSNPEKSHSLNNRNTIHPLISVLYVDDEPALLDPIRHYLERKGNFSVDTITSAKDALLKIKEKKYDVIVSDYQMPGLDGIQFLRILREDNNPIPFIIFTGKGHEDVVVEAYNAGADFYIPKGGNPKAMFLDLTQKITQIVTRRRSEEALFESEERYRKVVEQSHDAIFIFQGSRLVFANDRVPEISGYSKEELYAMDIWEIIHPDDREYLLNNAQDHDTGSPVPTTYESRIITKSKEIRYLEIAVTSLTFNGIDSILGSVRDITERKSAEAALRKSEEKYRSIFDTFDDLYYQTDMKGIITTLSPSCKRITGWKASELIGQQVLDLYPFPEQRKLLLSTMFMNGAVHDYEVILKNKKGEHLNVSVTSHVVRDDKGEPVAIEGVLRDITKRINMEKALHASEVRYRTLADFLPVMVFEADINGMLTFGNRLILPVFGIDPSSIGADINIMNYIVPEERQKAQENMGKMYAGIPRSSHEYTLIRKDGTTFPTLINTSAILDDKTGAPLGMRGVIVDLSERRQMEDALRASETYLKTIFNSVQTALVIIDPDTHTVFDLNPAAVTLIGADRKTIIGEPCQKSICPIKPGRCPITDLHLQFVDTEQLLITATGKRIPVTKTIVPVTISGKEYLLENILDNTDRKLAEDAMQRAYFELEQKVDERTAELSRLTESLKNEIAERNRVMIALRVSEEKYRSLVDQIGDIVFHIDQNGLLTYISPHVLAASGMNPELFTKFPVLELIPTEFRETVATLIDTALTTRKPISGFEIQVPEGVIHNARVYEVNATPTYEKSGEFTGYSGIARDITERKHLQNEVTASLKEKEILLKEIHHRVKNNMQVISSLLSLQAKMVKDPKSREAIQESQNRVMSIALVHEKLYQSKSLAQIDYSEYIKKMAENLFDSYNVHMGKIQLVVEAGNIVLPITKAIPVSLIINELLSNSLKYAFPLERAGTVGITFRKEGDRHFLTVWDNGVGLPPGFQWDQTDTLGLQLVNSLVGQLAGKISFSGDKGTEFRIEFNVDTSAGDHYG